MREPADSSRPAEGSIVVSGTGRVAVQPDVADIRLGVSVSRLMVDEARQDAAATMASILAAVRANYDGRRRVNARRIRLARDRPPSHGRVPHDMINLASSVRRLGVAVLIVTFVAACR